jgi:oxygen-dependent protoporphyrinogen oxidase
MSPIPTVGNVLFKDWIGSLFSRKQTEDLSVAELVTRRFGSSMANDLFSAMCLGIFAGDFNKLSAQACFPDMFSAAARGRPITLSTTFKPFRDSCEQLAKKMTRSEDSDFIRSLPDVTMYSLHNGLETLTKQLHASLQALPSSRFRGFLNAPVSSLRFLDDRVAVNFNSVSENFDHVFSAVNSASISQLLPSNLSSIKSQLDAMPHTSVWTINISYSSDVLHNYPGFGVLLPLQEQSPPILGVTFDSYLFQTQKPEPRCRATVMIGGEKNPEFKAISSDQAAEIAVDAMQKIFAINQAPEYVYAQLHKNCIAQYAVGHRERVSAIRKQLPARLELIGSSFDGVSINDCVRNSKKTALACTAARAQ